MQNNDVTYFDSFGVIGNKNIKTNIFRIREYDTIMCGYFCTVLLILCLQERI